MAVAVLSHPACALHETGHGHPERPERVGAVSDALAAAPFASSLAWIEAPQAGRAALERVHGAAYVDSVFRCAPTSGLVQLDADTSIGPHSLEASLRAAGAVVHAVDLVLGGEIESAFCNVRPPGHHAERNKAMGFCLFDNVAVGAAHAAAAHGLERIAIVDFDVHHGNGTESVFADATRHEGRILFCSSFQHPLFPDSGADTRSAHILNVPLRAGSDGAAFRAAVSARWFDALAAFRAQLVLFSAGFDAHAADPLADLRLRSEDFAWITSEVKRVTDTHTGGRVVSTLDLRVIKIQHWRIVKNSDRNSGHLSMYRVLFDLFSGKQPIAGINQCHICAGD